MKARPWKDSQTACLPSLLPVKQSWAPLDDLRHELHSTNRSQGIPDAVVHHGNAAQLRHPLRCGCYDVERLLYSLATDVDPEKDCQGPDEITADDLRTAVKVLSYLIVRPNAIAHASTLPDVITGQDPPPKDETQQLYRVIHRFAEPCSVFSESDAGCVGVNIAATQDDPWNGYL